MRTITRGIMLALCGALFGMLMIPAAKADPWNKKTIVTLYEPLEISGTVLDPGTYVFQLADSPSNRHIVQIWTGDGMHLITTILAIPSYRMEPRGHTVMTYNERPADQATALREWFYPGDNTGQEFVYHYRYPRHAHSQHEYSPDDRQ